jgi:hypothetical protein
MFLKAALLIYMPDLLLCPYKRSNMLTSDYRKPHPLHPHDVPEKASNKGKRKELVELQDVVLSDFSPTLERRFATHDAFPIKSR